MICDFVVLIFALFVRTLKVAPKARLLHQMCQNLGYAHFPRCLSNGPYSFLDISLQTNATDNLS